MAADKKQDDLQGQVNKLGAQIKDLQFQITTMQRIGGFTDAKTLSMRATRIEDRLEIVERDGAMLKDLSGLTIAAFGEHLKRHDIPLVTDNGDDTIAFRKIVRRAREWAEKAGLLKKRNDLTETRRDENRMRPAESARA